MLPDKQQILVAVSIEAIYGYIMLKFKMLLIVEGGNVIIVDGTQKLIYEFDDTVGEAHG